MANNNDNADSGGGGGDTFGDSTPTLGIKGDDNGNFYLVITAELVKKPSGPVEDDGFSGGGHGGVDFGSGPGNQLQFRIPVSLVP